MIKWITLEDYGKFKDSRFDLGPFTVVYGANETGKTTLFDALFEAACAGAPKKGRAWTRLAARYGESRKAQVSGSAPKFRDAVEFLELFSIRAGQISVDAEQGGSWGEAAKNSLYRHGYNPAEVAEKLEKRASTSNATKHQKNLNRLNFDLAEAREEIARLRGQEAAVAGAKEGIVKIEAEINALAARKAGLEAELAAAAERLEGHKKVRALHQGLRDRDFIAGVIQDEARLAELKAYKAGAIQEYDALLGKIAETERGLAETGGTINAALDTIEKLENESCSLLESQHAAHRVADAAQGLLPELSKISALRHGLFAALRLPAGLRYGIWAFGAGGIALGVYLGRQGPAGYAVAALFAAAAFALDRYLYWPKNSPADLAAEQARLGVIYDQWVNLGFERAAIERDTLSGVTEALMNFKSMAMSWDIAVENNRRDGLAARAALKDLESRSLALAEEKDNCALAAQDWLAGAGCASRDEFLTKVNQQESLD
ncbi:MAG TPA: AAA family ATPase, partial [Elusimicrobiales bacterium]|nr:AAA family ATPase [Elusimicrobiales bacterium]